MFLENLVVEKCQVNLTKLVQSEERPWCTLDCEAAATVFDSHRRLSGVCTVAAPCIATTNHRVVSLSTQQFGTGVKL